MTTTKDLTRTMRVARRLNAPGIAVVLSDLELQYADAEFLSSVRSVERRYRDERLPEAKAIHDQLVAGLQKGPQTMQRKRETSAGSLSLNG